MKCLILQTTFSNHHLQWKSFWVNFHWNMLPTQIPSPTFCLAADRKQAFCPTNLQNLFQPFLPPGDEFMGSMITLLATGNEGDRHYRLSVLANWNILVMCQQQVSRAGTSNKMWGIIVCPWCLRLTHKSSICHKRLLVSCLGRSGVFMKWMLFFDALCSSW